MLFTPENAQKSLDGRKTMTRRLVKDGERIIRHYSHDLLQDVDGVFDANDREKWQVGRTYAIQPGRGKPAIGRFRLLAIRKEKLQDISEEDARAEGCVPCFTTWYPDLCAPDHWTFRADYAHLWDSINKRRGDCWADNPDVWVLTFEVVK